MLRTGPSRHMQPLYARRWGPNANNQLNASATRSLGQTSTSTPTSDTMLVPIPPVTPKSVACVSWAMYHGQPHLLMVRARWTRNGFARLYFGLVGVDKVSDRNLGVWKVAIRCCTGDELALLKGGYEAVMADSVKLPPDWREKAHPMDDPRVVSARSVVPVMAEAEEKRRQDGGQPSAAKVWSVPRGSVEPSAGESARDALLRELHEETRIGRQHIVQATPANTAGWFNVTFGPRVNPNHRLAWPLDNGHEMDEVRWTSLNTLRKYAKDDLLCGTENAILRAHASHSRGTHPCVSASIVSTRGVHERRDLVV
eukprot:m.178560 g.178560  ORF g.178560 m.178560 type:complete len:312 (+) comp14574_c0_seq1:333-1268(+)